MGMRLEILEIIMVNCFQDHRIRNITVKMHLLGQK